MPQRQSQECVIPNKFERGIQRPRMGETHDGTNNYAATTDAFKSMIDISSI